jgi:DNA-binding response OmpR family regulator
MQRKAMRVLVATDRPDLGDALTLYLSERCIHVLDVLGDADAVLDRTRSVRPDAVLVDWRLGEAVSNRVVAALMHRDDPTPVVVLSTTQERPRARESGAAAYATLGDHPDTLLACLRGMDPDAPSGGTG